MSGASSRRLGHDWERKCANRLAEELNLLIVTSRSLGANYGADLATVTSHDALGRPVTHEPSVVGYSVECKAWGRRVPGSWLRQAQEQMAPGLIPVVLFRRKHHSWEKGSAFQYDDDAPRGWDERPIGEWLEEAKFRQSVSIFRP